MPWYNAILLQSRRMAINVFIHSFIQFHYRYIFLHNTYRLQLLEVASQKVKKLEIRLKKIQLIVLKYEENIFQLKRKKKRKIVEKGKNNKHFKFEVGSIRYQPRFTN